MILMHSPPRLLRVGLALAVLVAGGVQAHTPAAGSAPAAASAPAASARAHGTEAARAARPKLDLHAPPLSHIFTPTELRYILAYDPDDTSGTEVSVRGAKPVVNVPVTPGNQLLAVPWALLHPSEAWRVFAPVEQP